jgi:hypothetical protein
LKRKTVFIQILHEVSGRPKETIEGMLDAFLATISVPHKFNEEISIEEYEQLLNGLRKEKEGIRQWLMKGNLDFVLRYGKPAGSA